MKNFLDDNFLLETGTAEKLYHEHAKNMPIIDYHCHLDPMLMAKNRPFENITKAWLDGDHYKWRAMRSNGVDEKYLTGNASDYEKFEKWAETVPYTLRNPLYHWTHLELQRYFDIQDLLSTKSAKSIYDRSTGLLQNDDFKVMGLLQKMNVELVCTTDDPIDSLEYHSLIKQSGGPIKVFPAWRPDKSMAVENVETYNTYIDKLSEVSGVEINSFKTLLDALNKRHDFFAQNGCCVSDHGLETFYAEEYTDQEIEAIFNKVRSGNALHQDEILKFKSAALYEFGVMDHNKNWVQQYHVGVMRNNNGRLFSQLGPDAGFDSIGDWNQASAMSRFLNRLDKDNQLAKTIIYNINPALNEVVGSMVGNFMDGSVPGKIQFGTGWWFLDQKDGMEKQMNDLSNLGLISRFVGMLTDSRSFLSFPRHEYFRRILCNLFGNDIEQGLIPNDTALIGKMIEDICYYNTKNFFDFEV